VYTLYRDKIDMVIEVFVCAQFYLIIGTCNDMLCSMHFHT